MFAFASWPAHPRRWLRHHPAGRRSKSFRRFGVTTAGPTDPLAFATASAAVETRHDATAIEVSLGGIEGMAEGAAVTVAVAGGDFRLALGDRDWTGAAGVRLDPRALGADRGKLAQRRPGTQLRFQTVSLAEAVEARRAQARLLEGPIGLEPLVRTEFSSNFCSASTSLMVSSAPPDETEQLGWPSRSRPASRLSSSPKSSLPVPLAGHTYPAGSTRYAIDL
jgi:allophanate hydrolase subunit 2